MSTGAGYLAWLVMLLQQRAPFPAELATSVDSQSKELSSSGTANVVAGGADTCAMATVITGNGPFFGNNIGANTDGPSHCAVGAEVWYRWTADATGIATASTCWGGTNYDTGIVVYGDGTNCPDHFMACNDDSICGVSALTTFPVVTGNTYVIQIGGFAGDQGNYQMTVDIVPGPDYGVCQYDDGVSERAYSLCPFGNDEFIRVQRFGNPGDTTLVHSMSFTWGSPADSFPAAPNGTPGTAAIWEDPDDDGIPSDAVLLRTIPIVVANSDTDIFDTVSFIPPVVVSGAYFVGVGSIATTPGEANAAIDRSVPSQFRAWVTGSCGPADYVHLGANSIPPEDMDLSDPGVWLIRVDCEPAITKFCFPGVNGVMTCPCGNPPTGPGRGCNNHSAFSGGASLTGSGRSSLSSDSLVLSAVGENNMALTVFWTGIVTTNPPGVVHAAGVRCVAGLERLYTGAASGGAIQRPRAGDPAVSVVTGGISVGQTRYYFTVYRDSNAAIPCGNLASTVNLSNAVGVFWGP